VKPTRPPHPAVVVPPRAQEERFGEATAVHWATDTAVVLVLRGELDWRVERCISRVILETRESGLLMLVDVSAVTYLNVDVLALFLHAHADPGLSLVLPLPTPVLKLLEMTGTTAVFPVV
jgi:anti-anti-sigma regulatory factor